jgi:iron complex transport system ATP-binding protein
MNTSTANVPGLAPSRAALPPALGQPILAASHLSFSYDGSPRPVLSDLSLEIPAGTITAILGPNGSGKTTLLRLLLGVLRPQAGRVQLNGQPLSTYSRRKRGQLLGLVPQDEHIAFDFSVLEYVLLGRAPYLGTLQMPGEVDRQVALQSLVAVGLDSMQDRALPNLSGGERQLAVLARALAQQPQVLLMDEPTAHLDLANQARLLEIMRSLAARGVTLVLTTHDPGLASSLAGHAVLMHQGQVLAVGPAASVLTAENLSATYGVAVKVYQVDGRRLILLP